MTSEQKTQIASYVDTQLGASKVQNIYAFGSNANVTSFNTTSDLDVIVLTTDKSNLLANEINKSKLSQITGFGVSIHWTVMDKAVFEKSVLWQNRFALSVNNTKEVVK